MTGTCQTWISKTSRGWVENSQAGKVRLSGRRDFLVPGRGGAQRSKGRTLTGVGVKGWGAGLLKGNQWRKGIPTKSPIEEGRK